MNEVDFPGWRPDKSIQLIEGEGLTQVLVKGKPYMRWRVGDEGCARLAMVQLYECGLGTEQDLAEAFGRHVNSLQRYLADFAQEGMRGLIPERREPKARWKLTTELRGKILLIVLREGIWKLEAIQQRLMEVWHQTLSLPSIQEVLEDNGLGDARGRGVGGGVVQGELFGPGREPQLVLPLEVPGPRCKEQVEVSGRWENETVETQADSAGSQAQTEAGARERGPRRHCSPAQRVYLDQLEQGAYNAYAGGLLFAPLLAGYRFVPTLSRVITIAAHEGYSLGELGLGNPYSLASLPKALRRFLHQVRELGKGEALADEFALTYLQTGMAELGVMYIDGHFMPYYGLHPISKGWHGVRQIPMKGSYNFLAVDEHFAPWLFLIRSCSEGLLQKIPELVEKAKEIGKQAGVSPERLDKLIVVFDREGYCAELYRYLDGRDQGAGKRRALFISWAEYADKWVNDLEEGQFDHTAHVSYEIRKAQDISYLGTTRPMNKYGKIRAVVIQSRADKKRAAIYTNGSVEEISGERIVQLPCRRWGEEDAIKELLHQHLIDYTPGYVMEELEKQPLVDNPRLKELKKERAGLVSELNRLKIELAEHLLKRPAKKRRKPSRSQKEVLDDIAVAESKILLMDQQVDKLPAEIRFDEAHAEEQLLKLNHEKKRFLDCIKVFACNLQAQMCRLLMKHYDREKEVVPALAMIVERTGYVRLEAGQLEVTLRRFTNREIDYAARHLCEDLNAMHPATLDKFQFPIRYRVQ